MVKNIFNIAVAALCGVVFNPATAQEAATVDTIPVVSITEAEEALAISVFTNGNCFKTSLGADGTLEITRHGGWYAIATGGASINHYSNNDGVADVGWKTVGAGDLGFGYLKNKKGWLFAPQFEVTAGVSSGCHVENRSLKASLHAAATALVGLSHGVVRPAIGIGFGYDNLVSENTNKQPWRGNVLEPFVCGRLTTTLGTWHKVKNSHVGNKIIPVRGKKEIKLFVQARYGYAKIGKYWDEADALAKGAHPQLKRQQIRIEGGLNFAL